MPALKSDHSHLGVVKDGKISSESYTAENIEAALRQYEGYGVTTVLSLGVNKDLLYGWRKSSRRTAGSECSGPPRPYQSGKTRSPVPKLLRKLAPSSGKWPRGIRTSSRSGWTISSTRPSQKRFPISQSVFDFRAHFCHSAPLETHAFGFRLRANVPEAKSDFLSVEFHHGLRDHKGRCRDLL